LLPDEPCVITLSHSSQGLRFTCAVSDRMVATGLLRLADNLP
jgi:hypothetical protein